MKNRDYKKFTTGEIYHIFNRGNNREKIFFDKQDYKAFLFRIGMGIGIEEEKLKKERAISIPYSRIRINAEKDCFRLHAFCLMPNHFHLLVEQISDVPVSKLISKVCTSYAMYLNKKYNRVGHIFQDQFKAVNIENESQFMWISAYIHMNAVKDGLVDKPEDYSWSSYVDFYQERNLPMVEKSLINEIFGDKENFVKQTKVFSSKEESF